MMLIGSLLMAKSEYASSALSLRDGYWRGPSTRSQSFDIRDCRWLFGIRSSFGLAVATQVDRNVKV